MTKPRARSSFASVESGRILRLVSIARTETHPAVGRRRWERGHLAEAWIEQAEKRGLRRRPLANSMASTFPQPAATCCMLCSMLDSVHAAVVKSARSPQSSSVWVPGGAFGIFRRSNRRTLPTPTATSHRSPTRLASAAWTASRKMSVLDLPSGRSPDNRSASLARTNNPLLVNK